MIKIKNVWKDGTTSESAEGHVVPKDIVEDIYKVIEAARRKQQQEKVS